MPEEFQFDIVATDPYAHPYWRTTVRMQCVPEGIHHQRKFEGRITNNFIHLFVVLNISFIYLHFWLLHKLHLLFFCYFGLLYFKCHSVACRCVETYEGKLSNALRTPSGVLNAMHIIL